MGTLCGALPTSPLLIGVSPQAFQALPFQECPLLGKRAPHLGPSPLDPHVAANDELPWEGCNKGHRCQTARLLMRQSFLLGTD